MFFGVADVFHPYSPFAARFAPKQVQVMGGDCKVPDMQSVVFGGSGGTKQKTGHVMRGECEVRDI